MECRLLRFCHRALDFCWLITLYFNCFLTVYHSNFFVTLCVWCFRSFTAVKKKKELNLSLVGIHHRANSVLSTERPGLSELPISHWAHPHSSPYNFNETAVSWSESEAGSSTLLWYQTQWQTVFIISHHVKSYMW